MYSLERQHQIYQTLISLNCIQKNLHWQTDNLPKGWVSNFSLTPHPPTYNANVICERSLTVIQSVIKIAFLKCTCAVDLKQNQIQARSRLDSDQIQIRSRLDPDQIQSFYVQFSEMFLHHHHHQSNSLDRETLLAVKNYSMNFVLMVCFT